MNYSFLTAYPDLSDCFHSDQYITALDHWSNESSVWGNDTHLFYDFVCKKIRYDMTKEHCESTEAGSVLGLGLFGFFGAIMSVLTFCRRPFVSADVYLYRTVGIFECVHMAVMTFMHTTSFYHCHSSYFCTFFSAHIYMTISNLCAEAVEFIVVFLCIERTIACLTPQHFHRIHRMGAYRLAAISSLITSLPLNIIHSFDIQIESDGDDGKYREIPSSFASTRFYDTMVDAQLIRFCLVAPLIIVSTAGSIIGLWKAAKRKHRLRSDSRDLSRASSSIRKSVQLNENGETVRLHYSLRNRMPSRMSTTGEERTRKEIKQMVDLCCLQLCLAIPIVINYLLCMAERATKWNILIAERHKILEEAFGRMSYEEACKMIERATALEYLRLTISLTHMMAHGLHFYLYLLFSAKFRQTLCVWWKLDGWKCAFIKRIPFGDNLGRSKSSALGDGTDYLPIPSSSTAFSPTPTSSNNVKKKDTL